MCEKIVKINVLEIERFENDPEMQKMFEESENDIEEGKVITTKEMIENIRCGEI
ncbi:hypothetical protein [Bacillus sp. RO1]|uniref:hypothetical protein n=1 Tax=Bacillus sp. RO1 TaxID=2722703 RepID=UPI0014565E9B|nr:hypothetical protein [Bacillus sp. RO1]NLP50258.1 hypothetical protein [Bacillus sp. RO1]